MRHTRSIFLWVVCLALVSSSYAMAQDDESDFSLTGYIQSQGGIFVSMHENEVDDNGFPSDHGGFWGQPSMFRNTLLLTADWQPMGQVRVHAVFRGARSASLLADRYAQYPLLLAATSYDHDEDVQYEKRKRVAEKYYQEADLRELYVDIDATDWLNFRIGRQQVAWGETANARLMDMINPTDNTWHLSLYEAYEDQRIPMWIAKALIDITPINANIEAVFVPMIGDPENNVTVPLTFVGAWGLPLAPENDYVSDLWIVKKTQLFPENDLEDARWGVRWKQYIGKLTYTLAYYHGHQLSPPVPAYAEQEIQTNSLGYQEAEVFLEYPRQDTYGVSFEYAFESPVSTVVRFEGVYRPDQMYAVSSSLSPGYAPDASGGRGWYPSPSDPDRLRADFHQEERDTWSYAVVLQRANQIRFLNPTSSIIMQAQFIQTIVPDGPYIDEELASGEMRENEAYYIVNIPGYDCTKVSKYSTMYAAALLTSYAHGLVSPFFVFVYEENSQSFLSSTALNFSFGNNWRVKLAYNQIYSPDPYDFALALFRDRDEVNLRIRYQF